MFTMRWQPFRLLGFPIYVDASWLVILAMLTLSLGSMFPELLRENFPGIPIDLAPYEYWLMGLVTAVAFFGCVLLHELGHAVVARAQGMPIRGITLFLFGGVAEMGDEPTSAGNEFFMAIAGPMVSLILAVALGVLSSLGYHAGWPYPLVIILGYLAFVNAMVLVFNLIPAFPLDGGRVLRSILWGSTGNLRRATRWAAALGQAFAWLLIAWGVLQLFAGNWLGGIWMGLIGMFLNRAAQGSYQQVLVRQALQGEPVSRFMNPHPIVVPPTLDLRHFVEDFVYRYHRKTFAVVADERLEGFIDTSALTDIPRSEWASRTVDDIMRHDVEAISIAPDADALRALEKMRQADSSRLLVTEGKRLVGIISLKDLLSFLNLKIELEGPGGDDLRPPPRRKMPPQETTLTPR